MLIMFVGVVVASVVLTQTVMGRKRVPGGEEQTVRTNNGKREANPFRYAEVFVVLGACIALLRLFPPAEGILLQAKSV